MNYPLDVIKPVPKDVRATEEGIFEVKSVSIVKVCHLADLVSNYHSIRLTSNPHVLAYNQPWVTASLRSDKETTDSKDDATTKMNRMEQSFLSRIPSPQMAMELQRLVGSFLRRQWKRLSNIRKSRKPART